MRKQIYLTLLLVLALVVPAVAQPPNKQPPAKQDGARLVVQPGGVAKWRSDRIGPVRSLHVRIDGQGASYVLKPKTNSCVAYIYGAGVVARLTDCRKGKRVPYVRVRAVSAALEPVAISLRLN